MKTAYSTLRLLQEARGYLEDMTTIRECREYPFRVNRLEVMSFHAKLDCYLGHIKLAHDLKV